MKTILFSLLVLLAANTLKAQDTTTVKSPYEYAFIYVDLTADSLNIFFDNGKIVNIVGAIYQNYNKVSVSGLTNYKKIVGGFGLYVKAFNYLEVRGYEFMGTGSYMLYSNSSMSYYIYRKKKL